MKTVYKGPDDCLHGTHSFNMAYERLAGYRFRPQYDCMEGGAAQLENDSTHVYTMKNGLVVKHNFMEGYYEILNTEE